MYKLSWPYVQLIGSYIFFCHGDGSGGAHLYTKYHGRTQHYLRGYLCCHGNM